jgi:hypothetical protein
MRTAIVAEVGGYVDRGWPEDYDLILRLWRSSARLAAVDRVLLQWRIHRDRASVRHEAYTPEAFRRCKVHYLLETLARGRDGLVVWGAGPIGKAFAREVQVQGGSVRAFVDLDPRKIDQRIHGAPVIHPSGIDEYRDGFSVAAVGQEGPGARSAPNSSRRAGRRSPTSLPWPRRRTPTALTNRPGSGSYELGGPVSV